MASNNLEKKELPRLMRMNEVHTMLAMSKQTIYRKMREGEFPQSLKLGCKITVFLEADILNYINNLQKK